MLTNTNEARRENGKASLSVLLLGLFLTISGLIITLIRWFTWSTGIGVALIAIGLMCAFLGAWRMYHYRCVQVNQDERQGESTVYTVSPYARSTLPPPAYAAYAYDNSAALPGTDDDRHHFTGPAYLPPPLYNGAASHSGIVSTPGLMPYHAVNVTWTEAALQVPPPSYEEAISHPSTLVYQTEDLAAAQEQPKDEDIPNNRSQESGQGTIES
ncbi:uncharacterized protein LOC116940826 [Petromyzon marinus]|uniref:Uncharacterized protein LOC116940826 n=1 Tax=Petromyzon marinus TaxID=7757 RepID=A0AAJ7SYI2_PETMA|nr:uncharacterized protein LOC116940826 [Petromyzon marinus]